MKLELLGNYQAAPYKLLLETERLRFGLASFRFFHTRVKPKHDNIGKWSTIILAKKKTNPKELYILK